MSLNPLLSDGVVALIRSTKQDLMNHTCTVKRAVTSGAKDDDNQPSPPTSWAVVGQPDQPCRLHHQTIARFTGEQQNKDTSMTVTRQLLNFPYGLDVTLKDRIYNLKDRAGRMVDSTALYFEIKELVSSEIDLNFAIQAIS